MAIKCTKWQKYISIYGHKINQHFPVQGSPKFTKIGIWDLKIHHPATLQQIPPKYHQENQDKLIKTF
jgi:hypothetical protein